MSAKMKEYIIWGKPEYSAKTRQVDIPYVVSPLTCLRALPSKTIVNFCPGNLAQKKYLSR